MIHTSDNTQPLFPLETNYTEMEIRFPPLSWVQRSWLSLQQHTQWYIRLGRLGQESKNRTQPASHAVYSFVRASRRVHRRHFAGPNCCCSRFAQASRSYTCCNS
jgi:hypothetical protein